MESDSGINLGCRKKITPEFQSRSHEKIFDKLPNPFGITNRTIIIYGYVFSDKMNAPVWEPLLVAATVSVRPTEGSLPPICGPFPAAARCSILEFLHAAGNGPQIGGKQPPGGGTGTTAAQRRSC